MMFAYAPGEDYSLTPSVAFYSAMIDPTMLEPSGSQTASTTVDMLFPPHLFDVRLGGDASMVGSEDTITLPIDKTFITIGRSFGTSVGYAGDVTKDTLLWIPFSVWTDTSATQDDVEARIQFMRNKRFNVFESFGLNLQNGSVPARGRPASPIDGLVVVDYRWRFWYTTP